MSEQETKLSLRGSYKFWQAHWKESVEKREAIVPTVAASLGVVGWIASYWGFNAFAEWVPTLIAWVSTAFVIWGVGYMVYWLPYKYDNERRAKHAKEIEALKARLTPVLEIEGIETD